MPITPVTNGSAVIEVPPFAKDLDYAPEPALLPEPAAEDDNINVTVRIKKNPHIDVEIDIDRLSYKEMKRLRKLANEQGEDEAMDEVIAVLSKLTGQDLSEAPVRVVNAIMAQLGKLNNPNA
jgi:hypothetical protein